MSFLGDMLSAMAERGRAIIDWSFVAQTATPGEQALALAERLLSVHGEASALATASEILARYARLDADERLAFFQALLERFGPELKPLLAAARDFVAAPDQDKAEALHQFSEPRRQKLFRLLNQSASGTPHLIKMRADLLRLIDKSPDLIAIDRDFQHLFRSWFNRGFLELRRVDWSTPAAILERIIRYEAVHEIADWDDLRRRIDPPDRRLYAFFHPRLRDEPLIFVEVALTKTAPTSIRAILDPDREVIEAANANTAIFYSISDCQPGLRSISFGNFLIKQVVEELRAELPHVNRFVTLSPVPRFASWLKEQAVAAPGSALAASLSRPQWWNDAAVAAALEPELTALVANFLTRARDGKGRPLDPVARFHLGNGARLERINWLANTGPAGVSASHTIMVNYLYKLDEIERNHELYASGVDVPAASPVRRLATIGARLMEDASATAGTS
ncbi:malonyl-CoA decarboxylase [Pseudaminobacter sp. NGMCC 1.201702]|uniref:malonyl-CoA decarboxylase n=1 Tax=Pseudaminobacter sp. NGMCC 1.201702 TaxID=3391825 RepID=UPI0039F147F3